MNWLADTDAGWYGTWLGFENTGAVEAFGSAGNGTFMLDLENGFKVTHRWSTDIHKFRSGKEKRIARNDAPQESYDGSAILLGNQPRAVRARLARYAAAGSQFLFALPHEEIAVESVDGETVTCNEVSLCDWSKQGQRCVAVYYDDDDQTVATDCVIQSVDGSDITLDITPHADTCLLMPTRPVYFAPQQNFARYPVNAEVWQVVARSALFDFAPALASITIIQAGAETGALAVSRYYGAYGNTLRLLLVNFGGAPAEGELGEAATVTTFSYQTGVTTLGDLADALNAYSSNFRLAGDYDPSALLTTDQDTTASGGAIAGAIGTGAALTTYSGDDVSRPVWDERLLVETTATESIQAMTQIIDHGGSPYSLGTADQADWGRAVQFLAKTRTQWQWLKLFLCMIAGRQKAFWLPTWRSDLTFVSQAPGEIVVSTEDESDFTAWWPLLREHIQVEETDGTITYAKITAAVDNDDGTRTLTIDTDPASDSIRMISWLELCRFEGDEFDFTCGSNGIAMMTLARVVPTQEDDLGLGEFNYGLNEEF